MNLHWLWYALGAAALAFLALGGSRYGDTQPVVYSGAGQVVEFSYWADRPVDRTRRGGGR